MDTRERVPLTTRVVDMISTLVRRFPAREKYFKQGKRFHPPWHSGSPHAQSACLGWARRTCSSRPTFKRVFAGAHRPSLFDNADRLVWRLTRANGDLLQRGGERDVVFRRGHSLGRFQGGHGSCAISVVRVGFSPDP